MRRTGSPSIVKTDGTHLPLRRVEYTDRRVAEAFLQDALDKSPQILPVEEIDPAFAPLISLGREIDSIDNLFISPAGKITLVETKLWRNPEALREVVAQVLDYAARLSSWSYSEFEAALKKGQPLSPLGSDSLYSYVAKKYPNDMLPEAQFIDEVQKNLTAARFLLLVVGDGIRENLEAMLAHLHRQPQMLFTFSLIEIHIYESPTLFDGRLLIPMVVAHTTEVLRAVVRVHTTGQAQVSVEIEKEVEKKPGTRRRTLSEDEFFLAIPDDTTKQVFRRLLDFSPEIGAEPAWRSGGVSIQLPDPKGSSQNLTLFVLTKAGKKIYTSWLPDQLEKVSLDRNIAFDYVKTISTLLNISPYQKDASVIYIKASELEPKINEFMDIVRQTVKRISDSPQQALEG